MDIKKTFALATLNHQKNDIQAAQDLYNQILKIDPNHLGSLNNLGVAFDSLGDFNKSKDCYEKVITINPNSTQALNNLGNVFRVMNEHQKAINYFEKAIEIDPNFIDAFNNLAVVFKDLDMNNKAKSCYEKTTEIDPHNPATHNKLGTVLQLLGEHQKAKECFEKAIKINPNSTAFIKNFSITLINISDDFDKTINSSHKSLKMTKDEFKITNQGVSLFRLKHDVQQAKYLIAKNYKIDGIDQFQKVGDEILSRKENKDFWKKNSIHTK
ncbi:tetratricopeptide repeat protein [Candidatus Pelagibacter sp. Uisw_104]|uniref:tetratricopeptide repeat protein n=1 Tax=Candidatus Pelagibacter sp. Uisw_104 TaxID=3230983 RepID=UPI0039E9F45D